MNKLSALALPFVLSTAALAGGEGHEKLAALPPTPAGLWTGITAIVVFIITAAFLGAVVWPKILKGLTDRENKIKSEIESAEAARMQASMALEQYQKSLAEARAEAQKMIDTAKVQMASQIAEMKAKAEGDAAALKAKAMSEIEAAKKQALSDIYTQSSTLATQVAGKILAREVNGNDSQRFVEEALAGMR